MDMNEPVAVHTTTQVAEAELLKNMLESEDIKCELEGENQGSFAGVLGVRVLVRAQDEERARVLIATHIQDHSEDPDDDEDDES